MTSRFLAAAAVAVATTACAERVPMTIQEWKGQQGGPAEPAVVVASDRAEWARAWRLVGKDAPPLDFARLVGVMVFVGEKPTGGYAVVFDEPVARGGDVLVRYRVPEPGGFATQALARPWKARAFARPKGRVVVEAAPR